MLKNFEFENFKFGSLKPNPRIQELKAKGDAITPEEKAELQGLYAFKDNSRGAELVKKEALGTITPEEKAELQRLYAEKMRKKADRLSDF